MSDYRNGGEGFVKWAEDSVWVPVYPEGSEYAVWTPIADLPKRPNPLTGRSYRDLWEREKEVMMDALQMRDGRFRYRLLVFCWPRGEAKSFLACMVQVWRFFTWPKQAIMLCANSKDQTKFVHFDIIRDIILNSPELLSKIQRPNVREKELRIRDGSGNIVSFIRPISSFSGIVSNITGYSFSEIFQMKSPTFFSQIDGSVRNVPNALGIIDSTVSAKDHILYHLYETWVNKKDPTLFFSYRRSRDGLQDDYWHPNNTQQQLESYRSRFLLGDFERYFLNLWSAGATKVFTPAMVESISMLGADGGVGNHSRIIKLLEEKTKLIDDAEEHDTSGVDSGSDYILSQRVGEIEKSMWTVESVYKLVTESGLPKMAPVECLDYLGNMLNTEWAILAGVDRADPMKTGQKTTGARTILTVVAKGLPGSLTGQLDVMAAPMYVYFLLYLMDIADHSLEFLKGDLTRIENEYDGIDMVTAERWGVWDLEQWCEEKGIPFETVSPSYDRQKLAFTELYQLVNTGRFKAPRLSVPGSRGPDILVEELSAFDHDADARVFGSPEKARKGGIQDDAVYSLAWGIYGGRLITADSFRARRTRDFFGAMFQNQDVVGMY